MAAVLAAGAVSGCASPEPKRSFSTPTALCDMPIEPSLLDPVLPRSGERISMRTAGAIGWDRCLVSVDGREVLSASFEWFEKGTEPAKVARSQRNLALDEHVSDDRRYAWRDRGAVSHVTCPNPKVSSRKGTYELFASVYVVDAAKEEAMKKLVLGFAEAVSKSEECSG
ncbi:hypothetical protein ACIRNI_02960 [Streptomyces sp. NPDC093546]|uniref:hypothetical protein n=1 Tax=Streptomyces sp. NPDC093546 TaxID=3366040 RepID=UPI003802B9B4